MAFLDPKHFTVIAGQDVVDRIRASRAALRGGDDNLVRAQERDAQAGILGAEIVQTTRGWSVRYDSGLQGRGILFPGPMSFTRAAAWAWEWQARDPDRRYAWARRYQAGEG